MFSIAKYCSKIHILSPPCYWYPLCMCHTVRIIQLTKTSQADSTHKMHAELSESVNCLTTCLCLSMRDIFFKGSLTLNLSIGLCRDCIALACSCIFIFLLTLLKSILELFWDMWKVVEISDGRSKMADMVQVWRPLIKTIAAHGFFLLSPLFPASISKLPIIIRRRFAVRQRREGEKRGVKSNGCLSNTCLFRKHTFVALRCGQACMRTHSCNI